MSGSENRPAGPITITHARIRLEQGDPEGAGRLLREYMRRHPEDPEARAMWEELPLARKAAPSDREEPVPPPPVPATARELASHFRSTLGETGARTDRLKDWLRRLEDHRGENAAE